MKNEALNIEEWLDHYFWIGVDQVYLVDNGSTDDSVARTTKYAQSDKIQVISLPRRHSQYRHYKTAIRQLSVKKDCQWLLVADLDEFWFLKSGKKFPSVLSEYHDVDIVYTNWTIFGSSGFDEHPSSIRESLIDCHPGLSGHNNTKWLCRTKVFNPLVNAGVHKIRGGSSTRTISDNTYLQLNHYIIQSREFFEKVKMKRGDATLAANDNVRDWAYFERLDDACTTKDTLLRDLLQNEQVQA